MSDIKNIQITFTVNGQDVTRTFTNLEKTVDSVDSKINKIGLSSERISNRSSGLFTNWQKGVIVLNQAWELFRKIEFAVQTLARPLAEAGQFEAYRTTLKNLLQDQEAADARFREMVAFAARTPFNVPGIVETGNRLQALNRYSLETVEMLGDLAAASGKPIEQAVEAYTNLVTGRQGMAVKQFRAMLITTNDWIKVTGKQALQTASGTKANTEEMLKALEQIVKNKHFSGLMESQSKTLLGIWSNLQDGVQQVMATIGDQNLGGVKDFLGDFANETLPKIKAELPTIIKYLKSFIDTAKWVVFAAAIVQVNKAFTALFLTMKAHPIITVITLVTAAVSAYQSLSAASEELAAEQRAELESARALVAARDEAAKKNLAEAESKKKVLETYRDAKKAYEEGRLSLEEYNKILVTTRNNFPEFIDKHDDFNITSKFVADSIDDLTKKMKSYNKTIEENIRLRGEQLIREAEINVRESKEKASSAANSSTLSRNPVADFFGQDTDLKYDIDRIFTALTGAENEEEIKKVANKIKWVLNRERTKIFEESARQTMYDEIDKVRTSRKQGKPIPKDVMVTEKEVEKFQESDLDEREKFFRRSYLPKYKAADKSYLHEDVVSASKDLNTVEVELTTMLENHKKLLSVKSGEVATQHRKFAEDYIRNLTKDLGDDTLPELEKKITLLEKEAKRFENAKVIGAENSDDKKPLFTLAEGDTKAIDQKRLDITSEQSRRAIAAAFESEISLASTKIDALEKGLEGVEAEKDKNRNARYRELNKERINLDKEFLNERTTLQQQNFGEEDTAETERLAKLKTKYEQYLKDLEALDKKFKDELGADFSEETGFSENIEKSKLKVPDFKADDFSDATKNVDTLVDKYKELNAVTPIFYDTQIRALQNLKKSAEEEAVALAREGKVSVDLIKTLMTLEAKIKDLKSDKSALSFDKALLKSPYADLQINDSTAPKDAYAQINKQDAYMETLAEAERADTKVRNPERKELYESNERALAINDTEGAILKEKAARYKRYIEELQNVKTSNPQEEQERLEKIDAFTAKMKTAQDDLNNLQVDSAKKTSEALVNQVSFYMNTVASMFSYLGEAANTMFDVADKRSRKSAEAWLDSENKKIDITTKRAKNFAMTDKQRERIEEDAKDQKDAAEKEADEKYKEGIAKAFAIKKALNLAQASMAIALAVTENLATPWMIPVILAAGAVQLAAIEAEELPELYLGGDAEEAQKKLQAARKFNGSVSGAGTATSDSIHAKLSNGEYVVNAPAAKRNKNLLEHINKGGDPSYIKEMQSVIDNKEKNDVSSMQSSILSYISKPNNLNFNVNKDFQMQSIQRQLSVDTNVKMGSELKELKTLMQKYLENPVSPKLVVDKSNAAKIAQMGIGEIKKGAF